MASRSDFSRVIRVHSLQGERWVGIDVRPATDPVTGAPAFLVNKRDVTELKEVQQHAAEQSAFLRSVLDAAADAIYVYDRDGKIIFSNRANAQILDAPEADLVGRNVRQVSPHPLTEAWIEENRRLLDSQGRVERDETVPTRKGGSKTLRIRKQAIIGPGGTPLIIGTASDISDLDLAKERAQAGERAKGQFLATMSHEIRTPMTGVIGLTELLLKTDLTREQQSYAQTLAVSAKALLNILNDVLDYSKIDAGRMEFNLADVDLWEVCRETQGLFTPVANEKAIPILLEIDPAAPRYIRADPVRLRQILGNLVGNAVKFTDTGQVDLRVGGRTLGQEGEFVVRVQDSGIGMNAEQIAGLFRPFSSTGGPGGRHFGGTGLGLAITKALVDAMGGAIQVDSAPGAGSVFQVTVRCPLGQAPVATPPVQALAAPEQPARILVADDHPTLRMLIATMLRRAGHSVDLVSDGLEAVQAASRHDYDLLLLDMQMPEMDGMTATRTIRALPKPFCEVPIFAISADAMPQNRQPYLDAGLDGFLTKPIDWAQVDAAIRWARGRQRERLPAGETGAGGEETVLLDVELLDNYALLIGRRPLLALLGRIATAISQEMPLLCDDLQAGRPDTFRRRAQTLKSVIANFGARRLVGLLDRGMAQPGNESGEMLARLVAAAGADTMAAMRRYRSGDSEGP